MTSPASIRSPLALDAPPLLALEGLSIRFDMRDGQVHAVSDIDLSVKPGEVFALVGESGSGKSVTALSIMGLLPTPPAIVSGSIRFEGQDLTTLRNRAMSKIRGKEIGMVFQDPMSSLNPVHTVGKQIGESLRLHFGMNRRDAHGRAIELLDRVGIPDAASRASDHPHEFSGGMRQRAVIAMALACDPKLLIADEPTTALDVTVQSQIVQLIRDLQQERHMAVIWITHDLGVVAEIADRVAVMYGGRVMEQGSASDVYAATRHPYTSGLLRAIPGIDRSTATKLAEIPGTPTTIFAPLTACAFHHRCPMTEPGCTSSVPELMATDRPGHESSCIHHEELAAAGNIWLDDASTIQPDRSRSDDRVIVTVEDLKVHFPIRRRSGRARGTVRAVDGVNLEIHTGRTLGVVGESGCGKTTLGRTLVGLIEPTAGSIRVDGSDDDTHRTIQMIFQDPFSSMNPGMRVRDVIEEPLRILSMGSSGERESRVAELLEMVGLPTDAAERYPHEFSGGQRQRIAIARALAADPQVIVCDEPVSALDVSVQAQIVNLLRDIQDTHGLAFLFIAHDLAVVRHISDEVAVMYLGQIVERSSRDDLYREPLHPYTKALLAAVPVPDPSVSHSAAPLRGDLPSPSNPPSGCRFHTRCPVAVPGMCDTQPPPLLEVSSERWVACHLVGSDQPHKRPQTGGEQS